MPKLGLVLVIAVGLAWGINGPVLKVGLAEMPPWTFRALMVTPSGLLLLALARASGQGNALPHGQWRPFLLLSFVNITAWYALSAMALRYLTSTDGVLIAFTMPLWAAVFARLLLGERLTTRRLAALALGMAGMAALLGGNLGALGAAPVGAVLMAVGALSWGLGTVLFKRTQWTMPNATLTGWQLTLGGLPLIVGAVVFEGLPLGGYSAAAWGAVTYNLLVSMSFGTYAWFKGEHPARRGGGALLFADPGGGRRHRASVAGRTAGPARGPGAGFRGGGARAQPDSGPPPARHLTRRSPKILPKRPLLSSFVPFGPRTATTVRG